MNTRVEPLRAGLAIATAIAVMAAMMVVLAGPAAAEDIDFYPDDSEANEASFWESYLNTHDNTTGAECEKDNVESDTNFVSDADYRLVIVKKGAGAESNRLYWDVEKDDVLAPGQSQGDGVGYSHIITCTVPVSATTTTVADTTTTVAETTTTVAETTTTVADTTTTVAETTTTVAETTTTVADTTTTTAEVLGTVITTSTTAPTVQVTTTIADEVLDTEVEAEELPFTGFDNDRLVGIGVLLLASGLILLGVTGRREES